MKMAFYNPLERAPDWRRLHTESCHLRTFPT